MTLKHIFISTLIILLAGLSLAAPALADDPSSPILPTQFYGTAAADGGAPIPAGTVITAVVNDKTAASYTVKEDGKIGEHGTFGEKFLVPTQGGEVRFTIGTVAADDTVTAEPGSVKEIALTFPLTAKTLPVTGSGAPAASVITESPVPDGFSLTVSEVTDKTALPPVPAGINAVRYLDITAQNEPAGVYQVILTFTLTAAELQNMGVDSSAVCFYHNTGSSWELLTITDTIVNGAAVTFRVKTTGFSAYLIAATGAASGVPATETTVPSAAATKTVTQKQTQLPAPASATVTFTPEVPSSAVPTSATPESLAMSGTTAPTTQPSKTPAPLFAVIAGAAAAATVMRRE